MPSVTPGVSTFAESGGLDSFISSIKGSLSDFTVENLATILVAAIGMTAVFFICWFAYRFIKKKIAAAMKKGTL